MSRLQWFLLCNAAFKLAVILLSSRLNTALGVILFFLPDVWICIQLLVPNTRGFVRVVTTFKTTAKEVWLTIDDGPDPETTRRVLSLLAAHRARATFFVIGQRAAAHPHLITEILHGGHSVANHTHHHPLSNFSFLSRRQVSAEIDDCTRVLRANGAPPLNWFRAPAGVKSIFLPSLLKERRLTFIGWSARGRESFSPSVKAPLTRLKRGVRPGAILLTHESSPNAEIRFAVIAGLLSHLAAEGYTCVVPSPAQLR